ncbi:MAG: terminase large subunit, partial [Oscillospiraceae bacterium]|nr:terminase large subunit [Oscillospiraceae bacterium]
FGYTNDPSAFIALLVDSSNRVIYVFDEFYGYGYSNRDLQEYISRLGYGKERIFADSSEPKSIDELYELGLQGIRKARKGPDSIRHGIQFIQGHKIVVLPHCKNFIREISGYAWAVNAVGNPTNTPQGGSDHLMDAMRYALTDFTGARGWRFD